MEIGEGEGRAEKGGAVLGWFFMEEEEEEGEDDTEPWVKDFCMNTGVGPPEEERGVVEGPKEEAGKAWLEGTDEE